jgi:hypothetical protein
MQTVTDIASPPTIWRTKLRSKKPDVDHKAQVAHNFDDRIVGIGWGIEALPDGAALDEVLEAVSAAIGVQPDWTKDAVHTIRRFGKDAEVGDYIWTRDLHGRFRLGRITGPYRYENTELASAPIPIRCAIASGRISRSATLRSLARSSVASWAPPRASAACGMRAPASTLRGFGKSFTGASLLH